MAKRKGVDLSTATARNRLAYRGKPYFIELRRGLALGYRPSKRGPGKWLTRYFEEGDYSFEPIGAADDVDDADGAVILDFDQAQDAALEKWRSRQFLRKGIEDPRKPYTVDRACSDYLKYLEIQGSDTERPRYTVEAHILPEFGGRPLADVTTSEWTAWLHRLATTPPRVRSRKGTKAQFKHEDENDPDVQRRRKARVKRIWNTTRAACNRAWKMGKVGSKDAWTRVEPFRNVDTARPTHLKESEQKRLVNAAGEFEIRDLIEAGLETGARLSELSRLNVEDFDNGAIHIRQSKSGKDRWVILSDDGCRLFERLGVGRAPDEIMLPAPDGTRWDKARVQYRLAQVCEAARLGHINFHSLRHSYCTRLIEAGVPLSVVSANTGHSVAILTKHYQHLSDRHRRDAIRAALPSSGAVQESNVERLKV